MLKEKSARRSPQGLKKTHHSASDRTSRVLYCGSWWVVHNIPGRKRVRRECFANVAVSGNGPCAAREEEQVARPGISPFLAACSYVVSSS
jgi:hypothetical protein